MTSAGTSSDTAATTASLRRGLGEVRLGQARLLFRRTLNSCLIVQGVIVYFTALILFSGNTGFAAWWFGLTSTMVLIVFLYSRFFLPGISWANVKPYLRGHIIISGMTGLVWSSLAIAYLDPSSTLNLFISINIVASIALGGMLPSAEYRPSFVSLSTGMFLPFAVYWLITVDGPLRMIGVGILILYGFGLLVSARSELQTVQSIAAERNRRLTDKLQEQNRIIEKVSAEKSRFLAATSHDMSQPLQAQGFFIRAMRDRLTTPEQRDLLDKIEGAWRSQRNLLQALVETARLDSGAVIAHASVFPLARVLADLETEFSADTAARAQTLTVPKTALCVESDRLLVTRILRNLLGNAVKFTPAGGTITIEVKETDGQAWLAIRDTGPGIPAERQAEIFEEYVQLETPADIPQRGLGLGLPIVRQLAEKLDIPFDFESRPGHGTTARIALPVATGPAQSEPPATVQEFSSAPLILLVEDELQVRESLSMLLTQWGCRVLAAASGADARNLLSWANEVPRALIADKRLAGDEDGLGVIATLREEVLETVPAILLTGDIHHFETAAAMDALTILPKPADSHQLHAALDAILAD